ncbi:YhfC family glutamic-type intramembrane protease [Paenibacillus sediminis]|uniref:YhfC family intramembrane metalloprotease n=1 Tax=Paenibacillus sediminis TaxID=664909 RepID=A0ABS4H510_9BACL|nr:YhfC family glutamic-type intramembrane protease [Paenibacillus sediminis]MBP1937342.1 hypothetical protein [Paenibacillus sediminis]
MNLEHSNPTRHVDADQFRRLAKKSLFAVPLYVLVVIAFWALFHVSGHPLEWKAFGIGAAGWVAALFLRGPLSVISLKWPKAGKIIMISASGPLEETVRLLALTFFITLTETSALSLGQGWAAIEVVYVITQVIAIASLANRRDEKAEQAKAILQAQGTGSSNPMWGIIERISASAFHIGATLCIASNPWLVLVFIPVHSLFNISMVQLVRKSIATAEIFGMVIGGAALAAGLLLW